MSPERGRGGFQGVSDGRGSHICWSRPVSWPGDPVRARSAVFRDFCCLLPDLNCLLTDLNCVETTQPCVVATQDCVVATPQSLVWIPHRHRAGGGGAEVRGKSGGTGLYSSPPQAANPRCGWITKNTLFADFAGFWDPGGLVEGSAKPPEGSWRDAGVSYLWAHPAPVCLQKRIQDAPTSSPRGDLSST